MPPSVTASGSNSFDGAINFDPPALYSNGFGKEWGLIYDWSSVSAYSNGSTLGKGFVNLFQPTAHQTAGGGIMIVSSATDVLWFDPNGSGGYVASFFGREKLVVDGGDLVLTDTEGNVTRFHAFGAGVPAAQRGKFKSFADPFGNLVTTTYDTAGQMTAQQRSDGTATETYTYSYVASGVNAGLLAGATLSRSTGGGPATTVRKVAYDYYDGVKPGGNAGNLQLEKILDASNNVIDTSYFRYYTVDGGVGYEDGMKYVFHPEAYARLAANVANPLALSDAAFAPYAIYADNYFEYDADHRVVKSVVQGAGCSCAGSNGEGEYTYSYSTSPFAGTADGDYNIWYSKTIETLPDGNRNLYYHNFAGEPILKVFHDQIDTADPSLVGKMWATSYRYDEVGRLIQTAQPSAVKITNTTQLVGAEFYPDLVGFNSADNSYQYLHSNLGVIRLTEYGTTTTAAAATPGDVKGLLKGNQIKNGYAGTPIPLDAYQYFTRADANGIEIYPLASSTVFAEAGGAGARTTTYAYTWFGSTNQTKSVEVTHPTVGAGKNGPGTADVETTVHDVYGRPIWFRDATGFLHYTAYDNATGAVIKTIVDVDTARTGEFANPPAGWSTPSGGGLHLVDSYQVDGLGRTVKAVDPDDRVTHWVYNDPNHEVRVYRGWSAATGTTTGPTEVTRFDYGRGYDETFTMATAPALAGAVGSYVPTGAEPIANLRSLSRTIYDLGGRAVEQDDYFNLSGLTYSASSARLGTEGANYYATKYGYDKRGRLSRVVDAVGTITATAHDSLGRVATVSAGTADGLGGTGASNMKLVASYAYDGGGVGDGNLTRETQHPDGSQSANDRVAAYAYDWRNRLVATKEGVQSSEGSDVQRRIVFLDLNNLGEVTAVSMYAANGVAVSATKPAANLLRAHTTYAHDEQGRVYDEKTYSVDQSNGAIATDFLQTLTYYDRLGRAAAVRAPGGLVSKFRYDGAGRLVVDAQTDGAGGTSWAAAMTLNGDHVLTETRTRYNRAGDPIQVTTLERNHDALASATGPLFAPGAIALSDLGFETIAVAPGSFVYWPLGSPWTFTGTAGVTANNSAFTSGNNDAPEGNRAAFLQGLGSISQTSTDWLAGTYTIFFKAAQRDNWAGTQSFKIQVDGVDVGTTFTPPDGAAYQTYSATFTLTAGKHAISFVGLDPAGTATVFIDDVSITLGALALSDLGFETIAVAPGSFVYRPSGSPWTFTGGAGVSANDSAFTSGNNDAPEGNQVAILQGISSISQTSTDWLAGTHTIFFKAAQRGNWPQVDQSFKIQVDGVDVATFTPSGTDYQAFAATFTLTTAGTHAISFVGLDPASGATVFIDDVSIATADARVSHAGYYYDAARRLIHAVDVGTNGGLPYVRPHAAPTRSDVTLVTSYHHNDAGLVDQTTDPRGVNTRTLHDALGRPIQVVANAPALPAAIGAPTASANNTTLYAYDGLDRVLTVTAVTPAGTPDQTTTYLYGVSTAAGSQINSNGLLRSITQPDGSAVRYAYNALGEVLTATDVSKTNVAGTVHSYTYDVLGRLRSDAATTLGAGVDGAVRRVATDYDALGRAFRLTTYNAAAGGTIVNQVERVFNGFGQITAEHQEHGGAVNTATSLKVQYSYVMERGGSRLDKMTYPTGSRFLQYQYDAGIDADISRVSAIADSAVAGVGVVESYKYLGLGTIIERTQPQVGEKLTYIRQTDDAAASGLDRYSGLDRFGRVIDQNWVRTAASAGGAAGTSSVRLQYRYDRAGNALSRRDLVDAALSELYQYDPLDRLVSFKRGVLSASTPGGPLDQIASPTLQQSWDLDALGNWSGVTTGGTTTNRQFNVGNQTTSVSGGTAPTYDAVGNVATKDGKEYKYDAWGRLALVKAAGGGSDLAKYTYDALGRRAVENYPGLFTTHVYFTPGWNVIEERTNATTHLTVLGATGQIVLRDTYASGSPDADARIYARQNANGDVVALVKGAAPNAGAVLERYAYEPHGSVVVMTGAGVVRPGGTAHSWRTLFQGGRLDAVSGLYNFQRRDYDPSAGVWMQRDPIGLLSGDPNLYRFVGNNPVNWVDPMGLAGNNNLPSLKRGFWSSGTRGNGTFTYSPGLQRNIETGVAGASIKFVDGHIAPGGFPPEWYYGGSAEAASVPIDKVWGDGRDNTAANTKMREKLNDKTWTKPATHTWNHSGKPGCTTMELVDRERHAAVKHKGSASLPRSLGRASAFLSLYDAMKYAGIIESPAQVHEAPYYFSDGNSVFTVQPRGLIWGPTRTYVAGPLSGRVDRITEADADGYRCLAESVWGRYEPGSRSRPERFIPGTRRSALPYQVTNGFTGDLIEMGIITINGRVPQWQLKTGPSLLSIPGPT